MEPLLHGRRAAFSRHQRGGAEVAGGGGGAAHGGGRGGPPEGDSAADENPALRPGGAGHHARGHRRFACRAASTCRVYRHSKWYLRNTNARIRAKAADVVTTVVQNNPTSQQLVMEASGFEPLVSNFTSDPDLTARIKALGALSSLIRNNKPGVAAFRLANGYAGLRDALNSESARFQRKALSLTHYLLSESHSDCSVFAQLGFPRLMMRLVSSDDSGVREAALGGLLELAQDTTLGSRSLLAEQDRLRRLLWGRIQSIRMMAPEDLDAAREERQLVDSLWITCYHEPSTLHREGLVVLPGEESFEQPPDVAGRFFEPLRRPPLQRAPPSPDERSDPGNGTVGGIMLLLGPAPGNSQ